MGEKHRVGPLFFFDQPVAQPPNPGTGIHDNDVVVAGADFNARGVPSVLQVLSSGYRYGTARTPASNDHPVPRRECGRNIPGFRLPFKNIYPTGRPALPGAFDRDLSAGNHDHVKDGGPGQRR